MQLEFSRVSTMENMLEISTTDGLINLLVSYFDTGMYCTLELSGNNKVLRF